MSAMNARPLVTQSLARRDMPHASHEAGELVAMGRAHYWPFHILGRAPMLQEPVRLGDWLLIPAQDDSTTLPPRALKRIRAIFAAGIRPEGFVLVHEAPKLLKEPSAPRVEPRTMSPTPYSPDATADFATSLANGIAGLASMIFPVLFFVVAAAIADPILVAVTEDGYWIEIDRWNTE
jgi:hypothetical protein